MVEIIYEIVVEKNGYGYAPGDFINVSWISILNDSTWTNIISSGKADEVAPNNLRNLLIRIKFEQEMIENPTNYSLMNIFADWLMDNKEVNYSKHIRQLAMRDDGMPYWAPMKNSEDYKDWMSQYSSKYLK